MNEILIQTFIEKLELLEKSNKSLVETLKAVTNYNPALKEVSEQIRIAQLEIREIPSQISIPGQEIQAQRAAMLNLTEQLKRPLQQKTIHHMEPPHLLSTFLIGIIISLAIWISVLYYYKPQPEVTYSFPSVNTQPEKIRKETLPSPHRSNQKILHVKDPIQDSTAHTKQKRVDSLYKTLMRYYEDKHAGKQATATDRQSTNSKTN